MLDVPLTLRGEYVYAPLSFLYICPVCGDVWAKAIVESNAKISRFLPRLMPCRHHSDGSFSVPGSMQIDLEPEYNALLMTLPDVVKWEFERHLDLMKV